MLKSNKLCSVCIQIKKDPHLAERIYNSRFYMKTSGPSLRELFNKENRVEDRFSYKSLIKHVHKHQTVDESTYNEHHMRKIVKEAEKSIIKREIHAKQVWDDVIGKGMRELQEGKLEVNTTHLLRAAKDKSDYELRQTDQQIAIAEMVFHFASGENNVNESNKYDRRLVSGQDEQDFNPTDISAGSAEERRDRSRAFYQRIVGDAASPGADPVS